jgi:hypothetical protein
MRIRAARDHVLHADRTLVDRVDLLPPRYCCPLNQLPAPRLLLPGSGLERKISVLLKTGQKESESQGHSVPDAQGIFEAGLSLRRAVAANVNRGTVDD